LVVGRGSTSCGTGRCLRLPSGPAFLWPSRPPSGLSTKSVSPLVQVLPLSLDKDARHQQDGRPRVFVAVRVQIRANFCKAIKQVQVPRPPLRRPNAIA
jgi:hypothetical protein